MEAGILYTSVGPFLLLIVFLVFVFVSFRRPLSGCLLFSGIVLGAPFITWRDDLRAVAIGAGVATLAAAALVRNPPRGVWPTTTVDRWTAAFALCVAAAAVHGALAAHRPKFLLGDIYHYLIAGPLLYFAVRRLLAASEVRRFLSGFVGVATVVAAVSLVVVGQRLTDRLVWLGAAPLDDRVMRLRPDFGFPVLPLLVASNGMLARPSAPRAAFTAILAAALAFTYQRTFWVAFAAGFILLAIFRFARPQPTAGSAPPAATVARRLGATLLPLAAGVALAIWAGLDVEQLARRTTELRRPGDVPTLALRRAEWSTALASVIDRPLGHGLGAETMLSDRGSAVRPVHYIHNMYIQWSIQAGIQAAVAAIGMTVSFLLALRRARDESAPALAGSLFAVAVSGLALLSFYSPLAWVFLALGALLVPRRAQG